MHGIIVLNDVGASLEGARGITPPNAVAPNGTTRAGASTAPTGDIVGAYKSLVANECLEIYKSKKYKDGETLATKLL